MTKNRLQKLSEETMKNLQGGKPDRENQTQATSDADSTIQGSSTL